MLISIVVPVYREEKNIPEFLSRVVTILEGMTGEFEIIFSMVVEKIYQASNNSSS